MATETRNLPEGWTTATIGQIVGTTGVFVDGDWVESKDQDPSGSVRLIQLADVGDGEFTDKSARYLTNETAQELRCTFLQRGDILVARMPDPLGRACIFPLNGDRRFVTVVDVCIVRPGHDFVDPKYLLYAINSPDVRIQVDGHKSGSTRKRISRGNLARVGLPIAPYQEQRRIVARIEELFSELDNGIANLETARQQLAIYRQAVLKAAFDGRLSAQWREHHPNDTADHFIEQIDRERGRRYVQAEEAWKQQVEDWDTRGQLGPKPSRPVRHKPSAPIKARELDGLPAFPNSWRCVRLAEIAAIGSGMSVSSRRKIADPVEVPYLRVANVQRGYLSLDEIKTMRIERTHLPRLELARWDVLFNEGGDRDKLGRGWIWDGKIETCITQNHVFRATLLLASEPYAKWVSYWGNQFGREYFERQGKQTTNLASINKTVLSRFPIPLPPIRELEGIVQIVESRMTVVDRLEREVEDALQRLGALRKAILRRAFSGQLIAQDAREEAASVLPERIASANGQAAQENGARRAGTRTRTGT